VSFSYNDIRQKQSIRTEAYILAVGGRPQVNARISGDQSQKAVIGE